MDDVKSRALTLPEIAFADPAFGSLPPTVRTAVLSVCSARNAKAREILYRRGDQPEGVYVILSGMIRLTAIARSGDEFIVDLSGRGLWIGENAVLEGRERAHDAIAETSSKLLFLKSADIEHLLSKWSEFSRAFLRLEARRYRRAVEWAEHNATGPLDSRLAMRLVLLARRDPVFALQGGLLELKITQLTLSRLVGTTRQRVNQVLQDWEVARLIRTSRGGLTILDLSTLEHMAASS